MQELTTTLAVIEALGGLDAVMKLTGATYKRAFNWKAGATFPSNTYAVMIEALAALGFTAPRSLWGMIESAVEAAE